MTSIDELDEVQVRDVIKAESFRGVLIDFWSPWCAPCRTMRPHLNKLATERADWRFVAVNTEKYPEAAEDFDVRSLPTLVFYRRGKEVHRFAGKALISGIVETLDSLG